MRLREKLRSLDRAGGRFWPRGGEERPAPTGSAGTGRLPPSVRRIETPRGPTFVREVSLPMGGRHGAGRIGDIRWIDPGGLALLGRTPALRDLNPEEALFLDVETTGLMSGAGLLVFLVGLGYLEGDRFVVEQHFLGDPGAEVAFLETILERWGAFSGIVTFNGRQFDAPRIVDRIRFHRLDTPVPDGYHLDLFHLARRVWRGRFPSLALQDLEVGLLGHTRKDDLPGALCPAAYAAYLRGEKGAIADVFRHNLDDILSLAALTVRLDRVARSPSDPFEHAALAAGLEAAGREREALAHHEKALRDLPGGLATRGHRRRAAALFARSGDLNGAVEIWRRLWREGDVRSGRRLAIVLEHTFGDLRAAEGIAREALRAVGGDGAAAPRGRKDWEKRLARIRRKRESPGNGPKRGREQR